MTEPSKQEISAADDMFSYGGEYPPENGKIRPEPCKSCAFVSGPDTVRPAEITLTSLERATADYDDFLCHCGDDDGKVYTCAGWAARFADSSSLAREKKKSW